MISTAWPAVNKAELEEYFGKFHLGSGGLPSEQWERTFLTTVRTPFPLRLPWDAEATVRHVVCHKEVASSLQRIFGDIMEQFGDVGSIRAAGYDLFGGCYAYRAACGSHKLSFHAYGAAILLGPLRAPNRSITDSDMVVDAIFDREGWSWLGVSEGWGAVSL